MQPIAARVLARRLQGITLFAAALERFTSSIPERPQKPRRRRRVYIQLPDIVAPA
jgi:hypothetical protein